MFYAEYSTAPHGDAIPVPAIATSSKDPLGWLKVVAGQPLTFQTVGQEKQISLIPLYRLFGERYAVYWKTTPDGGLRDSSRRCCGLSRQDLGARDSKLKEGALEWIGFLSVLMAVSCAMALVAQAPDENSTAARRERLKAALQEEWEYQLRTYPELATSVGDNRYNDRLSDYSPEFFAAQLRHAQQALPDFRIDRYRGIPGAGAPEPGSDDS